MAVSLLQNAIEWMTVLRPGEAAVRETRGCRAVDYHTDGRLLHYGSVNGRLRLLAACDAHHVLALREGWLSIAADAPIADLCLELHDGRIDIWSSAPGSRVRVQGAAVTEAAVIRLNGRELPAYARERADCIVAFGSDWGEAGRIMPCAASPVSQI